MNVQPRSSFGTRSTIGCGRCPFMQGVEAGVPFPVGLSSLRLLTKCALSQAWRLGGLHRASPVPFRGSCFTSGLHLPDATPQGLIACLYKRRGFPPITSLRLVAHPGHHPTPGGGAMAGGSARRPEGSRRRAQGLGYSACPSVGPRANPSQPCTRPVSCAKTTSCSCASVP